MHTLTQVLVLQWTDTFHLRDCASQPRFRYASPLSQQIRILPSKPDIEAWLLQESITDYFIIQLGSLMAAEMSFEYEEHHRQC